MPEIYRLAPYSSMSAVPPGAAKLDENPEETAMMNRRRMIAATAAASAAWPFAHIGRAAAQLAGNAFIVSGFPAGGMGDLVARPLAEKLRGRYAPMSWSTTASAPAAASPRNTSSAPRRTA